MAVWKDGQGAARTARPEIGKRNRFFESEDSRRGSTPRAPRSLIKKYDKMSNKKISATEISRFLDGYLQGSPVAHNVTTLCRHRTLPAGVEPALSRQRSQVPHGLSISHSHLLVRVGKRRALCRFCGQSFPLTPSGDLDTVQLIKEALSRPLIDQEAQCLL